MKKWTTNEKKWKKKQEKKTKNREKKKGGKKGKEGQRGYYTTAELGPKIDFSHKNCQEKS